MIMIDESGDCVLGLDRRSLESGKKRGKEVHF
jgi:hypothetical protein